MTIGTVRRCEKNEMPSIWRHPRAWKDYILNHRKIKKKSGCKTRLVMTMVVRNEEDIIDINIRFHAAQGVDAFLIIDHASTDGTLEKLKQLQQEYEIIIQQKGNEPWDQAAWVTEACHFARKKLRANIIINNDADEFWLPEFEDKSIKSCLSGRQSIFQVERYNVLPTETEAMKGEFWNFSWHVRRSVNFTLASNEQLGFRYQEMREILYRQSVKVAIKPYGLVSVNRGSHAVVHPGARNMKQLANLKIYHFPVRNFGSFVERMKLRDEYSTDPTKKMGSHNRKWLESYRQGKQIEQFQQICIDDEIRKNLVDLGIAIRNDRLKKLLNDARKESERSN